MSAAQARAVRALAAPIVEGLGCDLEDVVIRQAGRRRLVRVVVDHDGGLPLDLVAEISRVLSRALDEDDPFGQAPYVLEVTSPGVDRPLTLPRHWRRATGRLLEVRLHDGSLVEGRLLDARRDAAVLDVAGHDRVLSYEQVARATVQVEFTRIDDVELDEAEGSDADAAQDAEA
ncbi:MAG TPA: ribosome maturation factor RimP [Candidatus Nanopelagicales bacterium]